MPDLFDHPSGTKMVKLARVTIEKIAEGNELLKSGKASEDSLEMEPERNEDPKFKVRRGVFVTIKNYKGGELRGCIGFISPAPIWDAVQSAAALAAFEDPRFKPLERKDLEKVLIEVSIMTEPEAVQGSHRDDYRRSVKVGTDGIIVFNGDSSGLLLPQVPIEQGWDIDGYLDGICMKAGLPPEALDEDDTRLMKFQCQIFEEKTPGGAVIERKIPSKIGKKDNSKGSSQKRS
jgi:uncharacterized protein